MPETALEAKKIAYVCCMRAHIKLSGHDRSKEELKKELDYDRVREEKIKFLENHHAIVLATSYNNRVTARTVTCASKRLEIYFMSWGHHKKCVQIIGNPKVALVKHNVNIEVIAEIQGNNYKN